MPAADAAEDAAGTPATMPTGDQDVPVEWRPLQDGVLRGPPLSAPIPDGSLGIALLHRMNAHGSRAALVDAMTGTTTTYKSLVRDSVALARALRALLQDIEGEGKPGTDTGILASSRERRAPSGGVVLTKDNEGEVSVRRGADETDADTDDAVVAVFTENRQELVQSLIANLLIGVPVTMLNPLSNTGELVRALAVSKPTLSLCSLNTLSTVLEAARSLPSLRRVVVFPGDVPDDVNESLADLSLDGDLRVLQLTDLLPEIDEDADGDLEQVVREVGRPVRAAEHTAYLLQCGRGAGAHTARLTHRNLAYAVQVMLEPATGYGWTSDDVLLMGAPMTHAFGVGICLGALALGTKMVIMSYFREQLFLAAVQAHKVSQLVLIPPQAALLAHSPLLQDEAVRAPAVAGVRGVVCAAAPLPRALHRDLKRRLQLADDARQAYGLTQASCSLLVAPRGAPPDTQGKVVPGAEAKIVNVSNRNAVAPLQVGELLLRAPSVMAEYFLDEEATREVLDGDGWLRTGDLAYYDRNGFVFVVDRLKDVLLYTRGHFKEFTEHVDEE